MNEKINSYQNRLFNKLFSTLPIIRKFSETTNKFDFDEPLTHFYAFGSKPFWYSKGEKENKFMYVFGEKNKNVNDINPGDATLIIDFDKNEQFNTHSLGIFSMTNSELHILINYDVLKKRYPYFNSGNFNITKMKSIDNKLNLNVIDLGGLNDDFIENLEKFIKLSSVLEVTGNTKEEDIDTIISEENTPDNSDKCPICLKDKDGVKIQSNLNHLKNLKPELCGTCIEKIVASEFYTKLIPLLKGNETKDLNIAKEKFGNAEIFDIGLKLLEKYDIIQYIGVKKLFFSIDRKSEIITEYLKYSDENNLLIDNILKTKNETKKKKEDIDFRSTNLTKETTRKMNLFINALNAGKTHEKALKIAKIDSKKVENWYKFGKKGDANYIPFYNRYKAYAPENKERIEKMEKFLEVLKKDTNIENALKESDLDIDKVRAWYSLGEKGDDDYKDFYLACRILLPNGIPKKETKKIVNNEELMNEFIALIEAGKTNNDAITQLKIPKFKVKNWVNQGKLGNKKYVAFYNAYMIEIEKEKEMRKAKKLEKKLKKQKAQEKASKQIAVNLYGEKISQTGEKTCKICGRKLNNKTKKDICKRCLRKQYASKILLRLLKSVEPEKAFKKEDLKVLGLQNIQIQDYIWTLKEYNLITEENNKLKLKNKGELEEFIKKSGLEINEIPQEKSSVKLNKTCKTCGETLEISKFFSSTTTEDGFEDNCKDCKRLITAATYLKEIIEFVEFESEFSEENLKPHFKNSFQLQAKIWALLDNDLLKKNFERNTYTLTDEKTANAFLNKYYEESNKKQIKEWPNVEPINNAPLELTKKDQMDIILQEISNGKSRKEAAEAANIPLYKINHWYTEGRQGYGKDNVNFYKQLKRLENNNKFSDNSINQVTKEEEYENKEINRRIFLDNFKKGKTKEESAITADLELSLVQEWYFKGKNNEKPFIEFYDKYMEIKNKPTDVKIPKLEKTDKFGNNITVNQMNTILEELANGKSEKEAINKANVSEDTYKYWINRGKQEFGKLYTQFYKYINEIKEGTNITETPSNEMEAKLNELLIPLDEKYELFFRSSKMNKTGIAWVNIIGKKWIYQKTHDNYPLKLSNSNIYNLFKEVTNKNLPWGIRDLNLAKPIIIKNFELDPANKTDKIEENINTTQIEDYGIYSPLPEKYEQAFKSSPMNKSGIAWVNNPSTGTRWIYERRVDGTSVRFDDEDIYNLYKKVKNANQIWGIRDYERAKKIIDIPDDFKIPQKQTNIDKTHIIPEFIDPDIYAPLPNELNITFNPKQTNKTGIAWVNKSGSNWRYSRQINGKPVEVIDENIYDLHKKVKYLNYDWGIRDYNKAKEIIKIPENYEPPTENKQEKENEINKSIFAPLPKKYMVSFNLNQPNKTGIAWVNQVGNKWVYQRKINGIPIKFSDSNIKKLHEVVIKNNHIWGITNLQKARKIIEADNIPTTAEEKPKEINSVIASKNVTVTYIERSLNEMDIIIKGIIKNNELIKILNKLELFEENIKRINTISINNQVDIFIELNLNKYVLRKFEVKIEELGWKIN